MNQQIAQLTLVVDDYDKAIGFYTQKLGFILKEDTVLNETKRWVVVGPKNSSCNLLFAKAASEEQKKTIANHTGGRVFLFLNTDDFWRDHKMFQQNGVEFVREPVEEKWGTVAVFKDLYGNLWDLIETNS